MYIPTLIEQWQNKVDENNARLEQLRSIKTETWPKEEELRKLKAELGKLDRKINEELNAANKREKSGAGSDSSEREQGRHDSGNKGNELREAA